MGDALLILAKLLAVVALVLGNAFFVAAEFALVAVRRSRVEELVSKGVTGARSVRRAITHLDHYIAATQLGITLMSLGLGWLGEPTLGRLLERVFGHAPGSGTLAVTIAFATITALHIVIGELTPKSVALQHPERTALLVAQPLAAFDLVFRPAVLALNGAGRAVTRLLGLRAPTGHELVHSAEELKMLVEASGRAGALEESERQIIYRAFDFADFAAHEVMVPRTELVAVEADTPGPALLRLVRDAGYSRYPVYEGSLDQVVGILHVRDLLDAVLEGRLEQVTARELAREALFVPDSLPVDELLNRMREQGTTIAVVLDEFGGTAGLVTLENVLERLVGSLRDEFEREREPEVQHLPDGSTLLSGLTLISDVNEMFRLDLDDREYDTIGGYIFGTLGRLPKPGDVVPVKGYDLRVERMDGRRVDRVRVIPRPERDAPATDEDEAEPP